MLVPKHLFLTNGKPTIFSAPFVGIESRYNISSFEFVCNICSTKHDIFEGKILDYGNCLEIRSVLCCAKCGHNHLIQMRFYNGGRILQNIPGKGWCEGHHSSKKKEKVLNNLNKLFKKIRR